MTAIAPAAAELAIMYIELAYLMDRAFPDTEEGDDLTRKCQERSVFRTPATAAIRKGYFEDGDGGAMDVPIGSRYSGDALNYVVTEKITTGQFKLLCETAGAAGNQYQGTLFPDRLCRRPGRGASGRHSDQRRRRRERRRPF